LYPLQCDDHHVSLFELLQHSKHGKFAVLALASMKLILYKVVTEFLFSKMSRAPIAQFLATTLNLHPSTFFNQLCHPAMPGV